MADSVQLKRQVVIKTLVDETFRKRAGEELAAEVKQIDNQLGMLENQYQSSLQQLEKLAQQGQNVKRQLEGLNQEAQGKRNQLSSLKMEVSNQLANLDKISDGTFVTTGVMESFVDVKVGDAIYEKIQGAEILVTNGKVVEIRG